MERQPRVEFLNAAVVSYSPVIYLQKIKYLLKIGLHFDEVVVFLDISDIMDEATTYFCIDDNPQYRRLGSCRAYFWTLLRASLRNSFSVTHAVYLKIRSPREELLASREAREARSNWTLPEFDVGNWYAPLGLDGGIERALQNMQTLCDLLTSRGIPLTVVVYPWPAQLDHDDRDSRQVALWREFCVSRCKAFINLFPTVFAVKDAHADWDSRLFIPDDVHYSAEGNQVLFYELEQHLLSQQSDAK
jgi:hypothetical protein